MGSNKILTILSFGTSMLASAGWIILGLVPFSSNLQLHLMGALIYFLGATSFQLVFAITEFKNKKIPRKLPLLGLLNLLSFSIFSYFLIQVEIMQTPGMAEQTILEWIVYAVAICWVLAHVKYMHNKRTKKL
jgi:prepilin signal peptidase PulO-like enzyme (type II secretory pathway)